MFFEVINKPTFCQGLIKKKQTQKNAVTVFSRRGLLINYNLNVD